jgi:Uma2 family endonuclease
VATSVLIEERLEIPLGLRSLADFRAWALSDDFPEKGRIDYVQGRIEVDMSPEDLFSHGTPKSEIHYVVYGRVRRLKSGFVFLDCTRISCPGADLSAEPDIVFVAHRTIRSGRARLVPKASEEEGRFVEIEGSVDWIAEIISDSSAAKDKQRLPLAYFAAGVREFWLIDARKRQLFFQIYRRSKTEFVPVKPATDGFQRSAVFRCSYRLDRKKDRHGFWSYELREKQKDSPRRDRRRNS